MSIDFLMMLCALARNDASVLVRIVAMCIDYGLILYALVWIDPLSLIINLGSSFCEVCSCIL